MSSTQKPTVGRSVHFYPPQACVTPQSMDKYAAIITQVNDDETVDLVTFGPNSIYFQHGVGVSESPEPGKWAWQPRI